MRCPHLAGHPCGVGLSVPLACGYIMQAFQAIMEDKMAETRHSKVLIIGSGPAGYTAASMRVARC